MATNKGSGVKSILLPESYLHPGSRDMASSRLTGHHGQAGGREEEAGETCHGTPPCSQGNTAMSTEEMLPLGWIDLLFLAFKSSMEKQLRKFCEGWFHWEQLSSLDPFALKWGFRDFADFPFTEVGNHHNRREYRIIKKWFGPFTKVWEFLKKVSPK